MSAGHETTFCALLYCLAALGVLRQTDLQAVVTRVFAKYMELMRKVQTTYWSASLCASLITSCVLVWLHSCNASCQAGAG